MNRLKQIRERKSLTMAQVSAKTSIPLRVLTDYEANVAEITPAHVKVLSKALWVKPDELVVTEEAAVPAPAVSAPVGAPPLPGAPDGPPLAAPAPGMATAAPLAAGAPVAAVGTYAAPRTYAPAPAYGASRPPRPAGPPPAPGARPAGRGRREPVVMPATDGQITEIMRLAARLNLTGEDLEEQFGRGIDNITRFDAREWIKKLREDAIAKAPPAKVHFGQWPGLKDDREAVYLGEIRDARALLRVTLFNGQVFTGCVTDFTPYTITLEEVTSAGHEQVVLRKLAVAYYQRAAEAVASQNGEAPAGEAKEIAPFPGPGAPAFRPPEAEADPATATAEPAAQAADEGTPS